MNTCWCWFLRLGITYSGALGIAVVLWSALSANSTFAQELKPIADDSLGAENSKVIPINSGVDRIDGGAIRGTNLFHSFSQFHIGEGREAYFTNPSGVENILSRVTGSGASQIFGKLGVLGNANLFLINPNGIIFGQNASLDLRGSFVVSTASSFKFTDGIEFSATASETTPLLTISAPIGLQYGTNPGKIQVMGNGQGIRTTTELIDTENALRVQPNQTLALVGGDISLEGAALKTAGGRIELGSVAGESFVSLTPVSKGFTLGYDAVQNFGKIQISQQAAVDASGKGAGEIQVQGGHVTLTNGSQIETSTLGAEAGGAMVVNASELLELNDTSGLFAAVYPSATGTGGDLTINTRDLLVQGGAVVRARTRSGGSGGNVTVSANKVQLIGTSTDGQLPSRLAAQSEGTGDGGDLTINTNELLIRDGARVSASTFSGGKGGNLTVSADKVQVIGISTNGQFSSVLSVQSQSTGNGGDLTINANELQIRDGARISASTYGSGKGGNLTINANNVQLIGLSTIKSPIGLVAQSQGEGDGGDLTINTSELLIQDGAQVGTGTFGDGKGGNLSVNADKVQLIGLSTDGKFSSVLATSASPGTTKDAGSLTINTGELLIRDGAFVSAATFGSGKGGNLNVTANKVQLIGTNGRFVSGLFVNAYENSTGDAGSLTIHTGELLIQDGARVTSDTNGSGKGGNLTVTANNVQLIGTSANASPSALLTGAEENSTGAAGDLTINTQQLQVLDGAAVLVRSLGTGNAGNLTIDARFIRLDNGILTANTRSVNTNPSKQQATITLRVKDLLLLRRGSNITANASRENVIGGNVNIDTNILVAIENSDIAANSTDFRGGRVRINTSSIIGAQLRKTPSLKTSDITATGSSPEFNGTVELNTPDVDPSRGLVELPTNLVGASQQIATGCTPRDRQTNSFVATGRSGLPLSPSEPLRTSAVITQWVAPFEQTLSQGNEKVKPTGLSKHPDNNQQSTVEAQGWIVDKADNIYLVAQNLNGVSQEATQISVECHSL